MKKRKLIGFSLIVTILAVLAIVGALLLGRLNQPSRGTTDYSQPVSSTPAHQLSLVKTDTTNRYFSFAYPNLLKLKSSVAGTAPNLIEQTYGYRGVSTWRLSVLLQDQPSGSLSSNSGYELRLNDPGVYSRSSLQTSSGQVVIMTENDIAYARTAYLIKGSYQASVSLTSDDASDTAPLNQTLSMILDSWQWH